MWNQSLGFSIRKPMAIFQYSSWFRFNSAYVHVEEVQTNLLWPVVHNTGFFQRQSAEADSDSGIMGGKENTEETRITAKFERRILQ